MYSINEISGTSTDLESGIHKVEISIQDVSSSLWYDSENNNFSNNSAIWFEPTVSNLETTSTGWYFNATSVPWTVNHRYSVYVKASNGYFVEDPPQSLTFDFINSPPTISDVSSSQDSTGTVNISYYVHDNESTSTDISLFYQVGASLNNDLTADNTSTVSLTDADYLPDSGTIMIGKEIINYSSKSGNNLNGLTRGVIKTRVNSHSSGDIVWVKASTVSGNIGDNVPNGTSSIEWTAKSDVNGFYSSNSVVRVVSFDGLNIGYSDSPNYVLDTKNPTLGSPVPVSINAAYSPAKVIFRVSDDTNLYFKLGLKSDLSDASGWQNYVSSTTINLESNPDTIYAQFKDEKGNTTSIFSATTPTEIPSNLIVQDTSNMTINPPEYGLFISWKVVPEPSNGFGKYHMFRSGSSDGNFQEIGVTADNILVNYYRDSTVASSTKYYYKVATEDGHGNVSYLSSVVGPGVANGAQDFGEGGGGTEAAPPVISNIQINNTETNSATIDWTTDELSDSEVYYKVSSVWPGTSTSAYTDSQGVPSMVTSHSVTISNLQPNTQYYFLVKSTDPYNNIGTASYSSSTFETSQGPVISGVSVDSVTNNSAEIVWKTNTESNSYIVYSTSPDLSNSQTFGSDTLTTDHSIVLSDLEKGTKYYFYVKSTDAQSNTAYDKNVVNGQVSYYNFVTTQNTKPPVISNISTQVSTSSVLVTWRTDKLANSTVEYGLDQNYGSTTHSSIFTTDHNIAISGLASSTTYHFRVISVDQDNNSATSSDNTFTTLYLSVSTQNDHTPPIISNISVATVSDEQATVTWTTNELSTSQVFYGTTDQYGSQTPEDSTLTYLHSVTITGLTKKTTYHYSVSSADAAGNSTSSSDNIFTTTDQPGGAKNIVISPSSIDRMPPSMLNVHVVNESNHSVTIVWKTNKNTDTFVEYGISENYESGFVGTPLDNTKEHSITLSSLLPGIQYHFRVLGKDGFGNLGKSSDMIFTTKNVGGEEQNNGQNTSISRQEEGIMEKIDSFLTQLTSPFSLVAVKKVLDNRSQQVVGSPHIISHPVVKLGPDWAQIQWKTDMNSNSLVAYSEKDQYPYSHSRPYVIVSGYPDDATTTHDVKLVGLVPGLTYHFQVRSKGIVGGWGKSDDNTFTTSPQKVEIEDIKFLSITETSVVLSWKTSLPAKSTIDLSNNKTGEKTTKNDPSFLLDHNFTLSNLQPATNYTLKIIAQDEGGNKAESSLIPFSTLISKEPPVISDVRVTTALIPGRVQKVQTIITWKTDKPATSRVFYQQGVTSNSNLVSSIPLDNGLVFNHAMVISSFKPGSVYQFRVESIDSSGNRSLSNAFTILTPRPQQSVLDLIIKNLNQTFGFLKKIKF